MLVVFGRTVHYFQLSTNINRRSLKFLLPERERLIAE
jgi:hypothetical protein